MKNILALLLAAFGLNTACSQNFENMEVKEFAELIADSNVVILDVRTADEYAEGHIKGAILIDQFKSDFWSKPRQSCLQRRRLPSIAVAVAVLPMQQAF